jgi:hypothetical protein
MRTRLSVRIPVETTPGELAAVASVVAALAGGRWEHLAQSFTRLQGARAVVAPAMAELLENLALELRTASQERAALAEDLMADA